MTQEEMESLMPGDRVIRVTDMLGRVEATVHHLAFINGCVVVVAIDAAGRGRRWSIPEFLTLVSRATPDPVVLCTDGHVEKAREGSASNVLSADVAAVKYVRPATLGYYQGDDRFREHDVHSQMLILDGIAAMKRAAGAALEEKKKPAHPLVWNAAMMGGPTDTPRLRR